MSRRLVNCCIVLVIFLIGISLGSFDSKSNKNIDNIETTENNSISSPVDIDEVNNGFINKLAKEGEYLVDSFFSFVFDLIGGGIKLILGF